MPRTYKTLRRLINWGLEVYFVDIQSSGEENIPASGPVIFAANHPNSIMDTMLLGTRTSRQVHYMARSGLFKNPLVAMLFNKCGVIPLYRASDGGDMSQNKSSFDRAFETLEQGRALGIFPEGQNSQERRVLKVKTGTARIALGAEARNDFKLGVKIIPVGLNFQDRDQSFSSVLLSFGEPIDARQWAQQWEEDDREAVRSLTAEVQQGIESQTVHIEHKLALQLSTHLLEISGGKLLDGLAAEDDQLRVLIPTNDERNTGLRKELFDQLRSVSRKPNLARTMGTHQVLADAIEHFVEHAPARVATLHSAMIKYRDHLAQVSLRHDFGRRHPSRLSSRKDGVRLTLYAILFGPVAFFGLIHNFAPYQATRFAALRAPDEAIRAMTAFVSGAALFGAWYSLFAWLLLRASSETWFIAAYLGAMFVSGFFFLRYYSTVTALRNRILARTLFRTRRNLINTLLTQRGRLLTEAHALLEDYVTAGGAINHIGEEPTSAATE